MKNVTKVVHQFIRQMRNDRKDAPELDNQMLLSQDLGLGSMEQVNLFTMLSEEFHVDILRFEDEELTGLRSIADIINLFERKQH